MNSEQLPDVAFVEAWLTRAFMAPAFLWWLYPGRFSRDTYTRRGRMLPSTSPPPLAPRKT